MMGMYGDELQVLKWAAGLTEDAPLEPQIDPDLLLEAIREHRLVRRFLRRFRKGRIRWILPNFVADLREEYLKAENRLQGQVVALRELTDAGRCIGAPLIVIKGMSIYALTRQKRSLRPSNDIDILAANMEQLLQSMLDLGYRHERATVHEEARLKRDGVMVDIHNYFPLWSYPDAMERISLRPNDHPGLWLQWNNIEDNQLQYPDVLEHAMPGRVLVPDGLLVPNYEMAALIICGHIFRMYCFFPLSLPMATVRLAELADFHDLVHSRAFDDQRFLTLVRKFHGHHSVALVLSLLSAYLDSPSACRVAKLSRALAAGSACHEGEGFTGPFPRQLWEGFWATLDQPVDDLLIRSGTMDSLVKQLGGIEVPVGPSGFSAIYSTDTSGLGITVERMLVHGVRPDALPLRFSVQRLGDNLEIEVCITSPFGSGIERVRLDFGDTFCEWSCDVPSRSVRLENWPFIEWEAKAEDIAGGRKVRFTMSLPDIMAATVWDRQRLPTAGTSIPLLLGALRQNPEREILCGVLISLRVTQV